MKPPDFPSRVGSFKAVTLLATGFLALAAFFIWDIARQELGMAEQPKPQTPEEKILAVTSKNPVPATELAQICDEFPQQAQKLLKDRKMDVVGVVKKLWSRGSSDSDYAIDLLGTPKRVVTLYSEFSRYFAATGSVNTSVRFKKIGVELLAHEEPNRTRSKTIDPSTVQAWVVCREKEETKQTCIFERIDPGSIKLLVPSIPRGGIHSSEGR
jgi:hypothetical protein